MTRVSVIANTPSVSATKRPNSTGSAARSYLLSSVGRALLPGEWAVLFRVTIWPLDAVLARLQWRAA